LLSIFFKKNFLYYYFLFSFIFLNKHKPTQTEQEPTQPQFLRKKQITVEEFDILVESEKTNAAALQTAVKQNSLPKLGNSNSLSSLKDGSLDQINPIIPTPVSKSTSTNSVKDYFLRKDGSPPKFKEDARNVRQKLRESKRKGPSFIAFVSFSVLGLLIIVLFARWLLFLPKSTNNGNNNFNDNFSSNNRTNPISQQR